MTDNINDGYMGSGKRLHQAYKKYGIENFKKEILKYFDNSNDLYEYEGAIVNDDLIKDPNCYNICHGGKKATISIVICKDLNGNIFETSVNDKRYIRGEIIPFNKNKIWYGNKITGKIEYTEYNKNYIDNILNNKDYQIFQCGHQHYYIRVYDENNNIIFIDKKDPNIDITKYQPVPKHFKLSDDTKQKQHNTFLKNHHQQGEKNSQYGTCWIYNNTQCIKIKKDELDYYLANGWQKGRHKKEKQVKTYILYKQRETIQIENKEELKKYLQDGWRYNDTSGEKNGMYNKIYIHNDNKSIVINKLDLDQYINNGWKIGRKMNKIWMHNDQFISKMIDKDKVDEYKLNGWKPGRL